MFKRIQENKMPDKGLSVKRVDFYFRIKQVLNNIMCPVRALKRQDISEGHFQDAKADSSDFCE